MIDKSTVIALIKMAVADKRLKLGLVASRSQTDLFVGEIPSSKIAIAITPKVGQVRLEVDLEGRARVHNLTSGVIPFLLAVVDRGSIPDGVTGLVMPPWHEVVNLIVNKMKLDVGSLL